MKKSEIFVNAIEFKEQIEHIKKTMSKKERKEFEKNLSEALEQIAKFSEDDMWGIWADPYENLENIIEALSTKRVGMAG